MVVIRLARFGKKHSPTFRITVADSRRWLNGKNLDVIGAYNPAATGKDNDKKIVIDMEKYNHWVKLGAQPSGRVKHVVKLAAK